MSRKPKNKSSFLPLFAVATGVFSMQGNFIPSTMASQAEIRNWNDAATGGEFYVETVNYDSATADFCPMIDSEDDRVAGFEQKLADYIEFIQDDDFEKRDELIEIIKNDEKEDDFDAFIDYVFSFAQVEYRSLLLDVIFQSDIDLFVPRYKRALKQCRESGSIGLIKKANEILELYKEDFDLVED